MSYHNPLLFSVEIQVDYSPRPFQSLNCKWIHDSFLPFLEEAWGSIAERDLAAKLRSLRAKLKKWNVEVFGDLSLKSKSVHNQLDGFDLL